MLKISQFAHIGMVSIKTLRYYDEQELLQPSFVDEFSGYRYYEASQLAQLNSIFSLKDLGFSLEQVRAVFKTGMEARQIRLLLGQKEEELASMAHELGERLNRVRVRIKQMEEDGKMPDYEVVVKRVEAVRVASVLDVIPSFAVVNATFNRLFDEVIAYINANGGRFAGPALDLWLDSEMKDSDMNVQVAMPVAGDLPESERIKVLTLPAIETMACAIHHGDFSNIKSAHGAVHDWVNANGYNIAGPCREVYLTYDRNGDPAHYVTEIQYPIAKH